MALSAAKPTPSYGEENSIKCPLYPYTQKTRPKQQFLLRNTLFFLLKVLALRGSRRSRFPLRSLQLSGKDALATGVSTPIQYARQVNQSLG